MRSRVTTHDVSPDALPGSEGIDGFPAWRMATVSALMIGLGFGTIYTFGTFFEAMAEEFDTGLGPVSFVFSITLFLFFGTGAASGFLADKYGPRPLVWIGGAMFSGGLFLTANVDVLWHGYLTYGIGAGLGGGLFVSPLFAAVAGWFDKYRALGQGVTASGSGLGTLILLPLASRLIETDGWRSAYTTLGVTTGVAFFFGGFFIQRPPVTSSPSAGRHLRAVLATTSFRRLALGSALASCAQASTFAFTIVFTTERGITASRAALLVGVIGASSILGRLVLTGFSGRLGPVRTMQICFLVQPLALGLLLVGGGNYVVLLLFAVIFGISYGGFVALVGMVAAHLFGLPGLSIILGWVFLTAAFGSLVYPPFVGFLADATSTDQWPIAAMVLVASVGALSLLRLDRDPVPSEQLASI